MKPKRKPGSHVQCIFCKQVLPVGAFTERALLQGYYACIECAREHQREWRRTKIGRIERDRLSRAARKEAVSRSHVKWKSNNRQKVMAHHKAFDAQRRGKLPKMPCEICHNPYAHKHHEDYLKPLDVVWLCDWCHASVHSGRIEL